MLRIGGTIMLLLAVVALFFFRNIHERSLASMPPPSEWAPEWDPATFAEISAKARASYTDAMTALTHRDYDAVAKLGSSRDRLLYDTWVGRFPDKQTAAGVTLRTESDELRAAYLRAALAEFDRAGDDVLAGRMGIDDMKVLVNALPEVIGLEGRFEALQQTVATRAEPLPAGN